MTESCAIKIPKFIKQKLTTITSNYNKKNKRKLKADVSALIKIIQSETKKGKKADTQILKNAEEIIYALSAAALHHQGNESQNRAFRDKMYDAGRNIVRFFSRHGTGEETIVRDLTSRTRTIVEMELDRLQIVGNATRERLTEILESKKNAEKLAKELVDHVSKLDGTLQEAFCESVAPELLAKVETARQLGKWLTAITTRIEHLGELQKETIEIIMPWVLRNTQESTSYFGNEKKEIAQFLQLEELLEEKLKQIALILGPENRSALGEVGGEIATKSTVIGELYCFVEQMELLFKALRENKVPENVHMGILTSILKKSPTVSEFANWVSAVSNVADWTRTHGYKATNDPYLKTLFVMDLGKTTKPEELFSRVITHLEQIDSLRRALVPAMEAMAGKRLMMTQKVQDAIAKLRKHLTERLEERYAEARKENQYLPDWKAVSASYDGERDLVGPLITICKTEKQFLKFVEMLLGQHPGRIAAGMYRQQGDTRWDPPSLETRIANLRNFLADQIFDGLARKFETAFPNLTHTISIRGEYPGRFLIPALASTEDMFGVEGILSAAIDRHAKRAELFTDMITAAYRKAFPNDRPQDREELRKGIMAALPESLNEEERREVAYIIRYMYREEWAQKLTEVSEPDPWDFENPGAMRIIRTGTSEEEIAQAIQERMYSHFGQECMSLFNAFPTALSTRPQKELEESVVFIESLGRVWGADGTYSSHFVGRVFEAMRDRPLAEIKSRLLEVYAASRRYSPHIEDAVEENLGLLTHSRFGEFLAAAGEVLQATDYHDVGTRNDICGQNSPNYFGLFIAANGMDFELMKKQLPKIALAAKRLEGMAGHYYLGDKGGQKLVRYAKAENFDELLDRVVVAYATGMGNDTSYSINEMVGTMLDRQVLSTNPEAFSEIFRELERRTEGLDKTRSQTVYHLTHAYMENADFGSPSVRENFREYLTLVERVNRIRDLPLATKLSDVFPLFTRRLGQSGASLATLRQRYCDVKTFCEESDVIDAIGRIEEAAQKQRDTRQKQTVEPYQTAGGFFWSREKLDFLAQTRKAQPSWTAAQHAAKIKEKFAESLLPAFLLVAVGAASTKEEHMEAMRMFISKKQIKGGEQDQYRIAAALVTISSLEQSEMVLDQILKLIGSAKGKEVATAIGVLSGVSKLVKLGNATTITEFTLALAEGRIKTIEEAEADIKMRVGKTLSERLQISVEKLAEFRFTHTSVTDYFEREEKITNIISSYVAGAVPNGRAENIQIMGKALLHLMAGDYSQWRYTNPKAVQQLAILDDRLVPAWIRMSEPFEFRTDMSENEFTTYRAKAVAHALEDAATHTQGRLLFTVERVQYLDSEITRRKAGGEKTEELETERSIIVLYLELATTEYSRMIAQEELDQIMTKHLQLVQALKAGGFAESADDLERMRRSLLSKYGESRVRVTISETDDFTTLMQIGEIPVHSCQSYLNGCNNHCLLAYVLDASKRAIVVKTEDGVIVGRVIMKLVQGKIGDTTVPILAIEPLYASINNPALVDAVLEFAKRKAEEIGGVVAVGSRFGTGTTIPITITVAPSLAPFEYSDTYGGTRPAGSGYNTEIKSIVLVGETKTAPPRGKRTRSSRSTSLESSSPQS